MTSVYLDANALIYPVLYDGPEATGAEALLRAIQSGDIEGSTSCLTVDEVVWVLSRHLSRATAIAQGNRLLEWPQLHLLETTPLTMRSMLRHLEGHEGLTPRDALHVATMDDASLETIVSADADFDAVDWIDRQAPRDFAG